MVGFRFDSTHRHRCAFWIAALLCGACEMALAQTQPVPPGAVPGAPAAAVPGQIIVVQVQVEGLQAAKRAKLPLLATRAGEPYDAQLVEDDVRRLIKSRKFVDVAPKVQPVAGGVVVIFQVVERPTIHYIKIVGIQNELRSSLLTKIELKVGDGLDPYLIKEARDKLETYYQGEGFDRVRVTVVEGTNPGDKGAVFLIDEGRTQRVYSTQFVGNTIASGARLKVQIKTGPPILYLFGGKVDRKKIDEDVERLTAYYRALGFFQCKIGRELEFNDKDNWLTLTFIINEGPRYKIRNVEFIGNQKLAQTLWTEKMKLHPSDFFDQAKMTRDLGAIRDAYGARGYVFADIQADPRFLEEAGQLDLVYEIKEGSRYRVGKIDINIVGDDTHTSARVVFDRLSLRPGDILDTTKLRNDEVRLKRSSIFANDPTKAPKIAFEPPAGMDDPDNKQMANSKPLQRSGSGSSSFGLPGSNIPSGSTPSGSTNTNGSGGAYGSTYRGQAPDGPADPDYYIDVAVTGELAKPADPRNPAKLANDMSAAPPLAVIPARRRSEDIDEVDENRAPLGPQWETAPQPIFRGQAPEQNGQDPTIIVRGQAPDAMPGQAAAPANPVLDSFFNHETRSSGEPSFRDQSPVSGNENSTLVIRGQAPAAGGYSVQGTGPDAGLSSAYNSNSQNFSGLQAPVPGAFQPQYAQPAAPPGYQAQAPAPIRPYAYSGAVQAQYQPVPNQYQQPVYTQPAPVYGQPQQGFSAPPQGGVAQPNVVLPPLNGSPIYDPLAGGQPGAAPTWYEPLLPLKAGLNETQTGKLAVGVGVNSDAGLVGDISLDEQNFDLFRSPNSFEDIREGDAFRGGGQRLKIEAAPGTEVQRYSISFQEPYLNDTNVSFSDSISYYQRIFDYWNETRVGDRVNLGYYFTPDLNGSIGARVENVRIYLPTVPTPPDLQAVLGHNFLAGPSESLSHDTRDSPFLPSQGHYLALSLEQIFGKYTYPTETFDARQYYTITERADGSGKTVLGLATRVGFSGPDTPLYDRFYAGGYSTLRGFYFRGASPIQDGVQVGGDFEFLNTVEYSFPITADDVLRGVVFTDFGTVESNTKLDWTDFRIAPGFGLRIALPALGSAPIALDFAFPVHKMPGDKLQFFSFFVGVSR